MTQHLPVIVIGVGPVGLAAAARLVERDLPFLILERGVAVGAAVRACAHVRPFSPWRYDINPTAQHFLEGHGRSSGYEQVRSAAGDHAAAREVRLVLPETGVCSAPTIVDAGRSCCGEPPVAAVGCCEPVPEPTVAPACSAPADLTGRCCDAAA